MGITCRPYWDFFVFWYFFKINREMNRPQTYFQDLVYLSCVSPVDATYEGVTPCALARLMGQPHGLVPMWRHVGLSRVNPFGVTQSRWLLWRDWQAYSIDVYHVVPCWMVWLTKESHQPPWRDSSAEYGSLSSFFLLSFSLPFFSSTHLAVAPLTISSSPRKSEPLVWEINYMSWYPNCDGYVCRLYRLILLYFEIFVWMNSCGRD
jgi:hypothetical protein